MADLLMQPVNASVDEVGADDGSAGRCILLTVGAGGGLSDSRGFLAEGDGEHSIFRDGFTIFRGDPRREEDRLLTEPPSGVFDGDVETVVAVPYVK